MLAITSKQPDKYTAALPVPDIECHRASLSSGMGLWIILEECNIDILEKSFYFTTSGKIGQFSPSFLKAVKSELRNVIQRQRLQTVKRTD